MRRSPPAYTALDALAQQRKRRHDELTPDAALPLPLPLPLPRVARTLHTPRACSPLTLPPPMPMPPASPDSIVLAAQLITPHLHTRE